MRRGSRAHERKHRIPYATSLTTKDKAVDWYPDSRIVLLATPSRGTRARNGFAAYAARRFHPRLQWRDRYGIEPYSTTDNLAGSLYTLEAFGSRHSGAELVPDGNAKLEFFPCVVLDGEHAAKKLEPGSVEYVAA